MINHSKSRWMGLNNWAAQPLYSLSPAVEEGMAMGLVFEGNGINGASVLVAPGNTDRFLGISFSYNTQPTTAISIETYTVPSSPGPYTVALLNTPINATTAMVVTDSNSNTYAYNAAPAGYQYSVATNVLTFPAADAGNVVTVQYSYSPTLQQAQYLVGDGFPGHTLPSTITGTIGLIRAGIVYTSNIDPSINWATIKGLLNMGPNGTITYGGSGPTLPNSYVYEAPSASSPFLGLYFNC